MAEITTLPSQRRDVWLRMTLVAVLAFAFMTAMAAEAGATLRITNHTNPAGDDTIFNYTVIRVSDGSTYAAPQLKDGDPASYGPPQGTYIFQASPPPGWRVSSIQCVDEGQTTGPFQIDLANARVTVNHSVNTPTQDPLTVHDVCAFTNSRIGAASGGGGAGGATGDAAGIAPTPVTSGQLGIVLPTRSGVSGVTPGRRSATATVRLARRAVVKATLLDGKRVLATRRVIKAAGEHKVRVSIPSSKLRRLRAQGRTSATLRLKVVIAEQGGATRVSTIGVRVRL